MGRLIEVWGENASNVVGGSSMKQTIVAGKNGLRYSKWNAINQCADISFDYVDDIDDVDDVDNVDRDYKIF